MGFSIAIEIAVSNSRLRTIDAANTCDQTGSSFVGALTRGVRRVTLVSYARSERATKGARLHGKDSPTTRPSG